MTPTACKQCSTFFGPFWHGFCPSCIDDFCANGEGEECGLPAVPEEAYDDVVVRMVHHERDHSDLHPGKDCMICQLSTALCEECNIWVSDMEEEDEAAHLLAGDVVLIGCEGYHKTVFRYVYWAELV